MQPAPPPWASPRQSAPLGSGLRSAGGPPDSGAATPDGGLTRSAPRRPPRGPCLSLRLLRTDYSRDRPASPCSRGGVLRRASGGTGPQGDTEAGSRTFLHGHETRLQGSLACQPDPDRPRGLAGRLGPTRPAARVPTGSPRQL